MQLRALRAEQALKSAKAFAESAKRRGPLNGGFNSAERNRIRTRPIAQGGSAQSHLDFRSHDTMRRDGQDSYRNSAIFQVLSERKCDLLIGDGPQVEARTPDLEWNKRCDYLFNAFLEGDETAGIGHPDVRGRHSVIEMLAMTSKAWDTDGDILWNLTPRGIQLIESERIGNPGLMPGVSPRYPNMIDGIELDDGNRPVAFNILSWSSDQTRVVSKSTRLPSDYCIWLPNPFKDQNGYVRGVPGFQALMQEIERTEEYREKTALAAVIATLFGLVIKSDRPADLQAAMEGATEQTTVNGRTLNAGEIEMQPGMVAHLGTNATIDQIRPEYPTTNYRDYLTMELLIACAATGVPFAAAFFDASGLSFSQLKGLMSISFRGFHRQQMTLANRVVRRVRDFYVRKWMDEGMLDPIDDFHRCDVGFPDAPVLDPVQEGKAAIERINANLETHDHATRSLGFGSGFDVRDKRSRELELDREKGTLPIALPGAKAIDGTANTQNTVGAA